MYYFFNDEVYIPIQPQADTDELAKSAKRLILRHTGEGPHLFVVSKGIPNSGWVIGVFAT